MAVAALLASLMAAAGPSAAQVVSNAEVVGLAPTPDGGGYWMFAADGGVFTFGNARFFGSMGARPLNRPIVGGAATPTGRGYWLVATDGGIFAFGDARFLGSTGNIRLVQPIVGMARTPDGRGYWLFARDGGVFAFGTARFFGSMGGRHLNQPVVAGAATPTGRGYWLVASDGGVFTLGDAVFRGSAGSIRLVEPIVSMAARPQNDGYWLIASDGGVFTFGRAPFAGSGAGRLGGTVVGARAPDGAGYWLASRAGEVTAFGSATFHGSLTVRAPPSGRVGLAPVASLNAPTALAIRAGDTALYIAERPGRIRAIRGGRVAAAPVLDISADTSTSGEQGLLGITFSRDGRLLYLNHTDRAGDTRILEYRMTAAGTADPGTRRQLLMVDQPASNHNGGDLHIAPDGLLYIALGDGGFANDPAGNAQNLESLLGKILRIDPRGNPYSIPPSNPFVGRPGRDEIWAYGLRNPWRFHLDPVTGDQWIADVGQGRAEEVNFVAGGAAGVNYGWDRMEGTANVEGAPPAQHQLPALEYGHDGGRCAITGGVVYRGAALPDLIGRYMYGDFCSGEINVLFFDRRGPQVIVLEPVVPRLVSFGVDQAGEVYVLSLNGGVFKLVSA